MIESFTIGKLARRSNVNIETIRFYQRKGLVEEPERPLRSIRRYTEKHARRIRFIKEAQTLGFSLVEVADLLSLDDGRHCREAERLGNKKLAMVRDRIAQLQRIEKVLATLVDQCHCNTGRIRCPLMVALESK